jgi:hypothetical protein
MRGIAFLLCVVLGIGVLIVGLKIDDPIRLITSVCLIIFSSYVFPPSVCSLRDQDRKSKLQPICYSRSFAVKKSLLRKRCSFFRSDPDLRERDSSTVKTQVSAKVFSDSLRTVDDKRIHISGGTVPLFTCQQRKDTSAGWTDEPARSYKQHADQGSASGQYLVGRALKSGEGVVTDLEAAAEYFKLSADQGNADGRLLYGCALSHSSGVSKNVIAAARYFKMFADQGNSTRGKLVPALLWRFEDCH